MRNLVSLNCNSESSILNLMLVVFTLVKGQNPGGQKCPLIFQTRHRFDVKGQESCETKKCIIWGGWSSVGWIDIWCITFDFTKWMPSFCSEVSQSSVVMIVFDHAIHVSKHCHDHDFNDIMVVAKHWLVFAWVIVFH